MSVLAGARLEPRFERAPRREGTTRGDRMLGLAGRGVRGDCGVLAPDSDDELARCTTGVDQLLGREARPCPEIREVTFHRARPNTDELGGILNGSTSGDERCEHVHLALSRGPGKGATQVPVPHAKCLAAAASHSSRPSIGMR